MSNIFRNFALAKNNNPSLAILVMKKVIILIFVFLGLNPVYASLRLASLVSDGMVLQQRARVNIWGEGDPGCTIIVQTSWGEQSVTTVNQDGRWLAPIATPKADYTPRQMIITMKGGKTKGGEVRQINDILIGEVWLGAGQSNMEMKMRGYWDCPVLGATEAIASAKASDPIRYATIDQQLARTPQDHVDGSWQYCEPKNVVTFGATAYFFAQTLQRILDIPVGIINCSYGGSRIEGWLPQDILLSHNNDLSEEAFQRWGKSSWRPLVMHDGMLWPMHYYTVKGVLWYQGCSNVGHADEYGDLMVEFISYLRKIWQNETMPFYFVEIAPYDYDWGGTYGAALLRESQWSVEERLPFCYGASTNDLTLPYERTNIHPCRKRDLGNRLAHMALYHEYGYDMLRMDAPKYERHTLTDSTVQVYFSHCENGFARTYDIQGLEVVDAQGNVHAAQARLIPHVANGLEVYSPDVPHPVAVRYCWHNFMLGNLANMRYLPIVPFRTDK